MEGIREVKLPRDSELLESFLMEDPVEFMPLISDLRKERFPQAYAGISQGSITTLVTIEREGRRVSIWAGDARFVVPILGKWGPSKGALSVGLKHLHAVLEKYKPIRVFDEIFVMFVDKERFRFAPKHKAERLTSEELPEPYPEDFKGIGYGIRVDNKVVSVGTVSNFVEGIGACGAAIGTDSEYRNRGYATSTLSYAVRDALNIVPIVTYPVESNNIPAIRVLEKLGFRFYSSFLYTEVEKRMDQKAS
ncbi:MAG: GNAT family N-acetyltransferase [Candidatus Bathyarchaeia archaeon]